LVALMGGEVALGPMTVHLLGPSPALIQGVGFPLVA
jgi:hypothetical protein